MPSSEPIEAIRELIGDCLRDIGDGADGFPVDSLLRDLLDACQRGPVSRENMLALVDVLLASWIETLERDMQAMASPNPDALMAIKSRMRTAQHSLLQVQSVLARLKLWVGAQPPTRRERSSEEQADFQPGARAKYGVDAP